MSPGFSFARSTRVLLTYVPFADFRSSRTHADPLSVIFAWRRDTAGCVSTIPHVRSRPTITLSPEIGCFSFVSGFELTRTNCGAGGEAGGADGTFGSGVGRIVG